LFFTCDLVIFSEDPAFEWVCDWLSRQPYAQTARRLQLKTLKKRDRFDSSEDTRWTLSPGEGNHFFWYKKRPLVMSRSVREGNQTGQLKEQISIRTIGKSQILLRTLLNEAKELENENEYIEVYSYSSGYWSRCAQRIPRDIKSLILPGNQIESIIDDLDWFIAAYDWYEARGIPWHRGYLFSGQPGTGKSSLAFVLSSYFRYPLYTLNIGSISSDGVLMEAFDEVPGGVILLIEDIDAIQTFSGTEHREESTKARLLLPVPGWPENK